MNSNNEHSTDEEKPKKVLNELEGLKEFLEANEPTISDDIPELDEMIPMLNETIPVLDQEIPELTAEVYIPEDFKISFDAENSTETVEQQLIRTHHELPTAPLEVINAVEQLSDRSVETNLFEIDHAKAEDVELNSLESEQTDFTFTLVESNADAISTNSLVQQQYELEQNAQQQRSSLTEEPATEEPIAEPEVNEDIVVEDFIDDEQISAIAPVISENISVEEFIDNEQISTEDLEINKQLSTEALLENAWVKVETLLMDNLPTQISGAFLDLLNAQVEENKQLLLDDLDLLDQDALLELEAELADYLDADQGF